MILINSPAHNVASISGSGEARGGEKGTLGFSAAHKRGTTAVTSLRLLPPLAVAFPISRAPAPYLTPPRRISSSSTLAPAMAGYGTNGKWDAFVVTNNDLADLKRAG